MVKLNIQTNFRYTFQFFKFSSIEHKNKLLSGKEQTNVYKFKEIFRTVKQEDKFYLGNFWVPPPPRSSVNMDAQTLPEHLSVMGTNADN